jgi:hypothetical protein
MRNRGYALLGSRKEEEESACRGESSAVGLQLRVRYVPAALLAMLRAALGLSSVFLKLEIGQPPLQISPFTTLCHRCSVERRCPPQLEEASWRRQSLSGCAITQAPDVK